MIRYVCFSFAIGLLLAIDIFSQSTEAHPNFDDYKVPIHKGRATRPKWIRFSKRDGWRDELGKLVDSPEVNFAGKFFVSVHSCGTGCRYYTLTDLTTGKDLEVLRGFGAGEEPKKTKDGYEFREELYFVAHSKLLIVQYAVEKPDGTECRERSFLFENHKLKPITRTIYSCQNLE